MSIQYAKPGQVAHCDFTLFSPPEMTKDRPVLTLNSSSGGLVTIVGLSSRANHLSSLHYKLPKRSLPNIPLFTRGDTWVKGDMVYRVSLHRLNL